MAEVLDLINEKMGGATVNKEKGGKDPTRELEAAIALIENLEARETLQAKLREMRATLELRAREADARARQVGGDNVKEGKPEPTLQEKVTATAVFLLEHGIDPKQVGDYLTGSRMTTPIALPGMGGTQQQGLTIADLTSIINLINQNKPDDDLKAILKSLTDEVKTLKASSNVPVDPVTYAKQQMESIKTIISLMTESGLVKLPGGGGEGVSLDVVKEQNRHGEKMEEIKIERDYKTGMVDAVGNIIEDVGRGASSQILQRKEVPREKTGGVLETFECQQCKATIYITPETGDRVKCAKCGKEYERPKT